MDTSDWIAIVALAISTLSVGYTIAVDRRRPRVRVRADMIYIFERGTNHMNRRGPFFMIKATNFGPGRVCLHGIGLTHRSRLRRMFRKYFKSDTTQATILDPMHDSPGQLPAWLDVGQTLQLQYPSDSEFLEESEIYDCLYIYDSLGGEHWAPKNVFRNARESRESANKRSIEQGREE